MDTGGFCCRRNCVNSQAGHQAMLIGQGNKFELWDEESWNRKRDEWLSDDDETDLPAELESLSL